MPRPVVYTERGDWRTWGGQRHTPTMRLPHPTPRSWVPGKNPLITVFKALSLSVLPKAIPTPHRQASTGLVDSLQLMEREPRPEGSGGGLLSPNSLCDVNQHLCALSFCARHRGPHAWRLQYPAWQWRDPSHNWVSGLWEWKAVKLQELKCPAPLGLASPSRTLLGLYHFHKNLHSKTVSAYPYAQQPKGGTNPGQMSIKWRKAERGRPVSYINTYIWTLERGCWCAGQRGDTKSRLLDSVREGEGGMAWEKSTGAYTWPYVKWRALEFDGWCRSGLCDNLGDGVGRGGSGGTEQKCACSRFTLIHGKTHHNAVE